MLGRSNFLVLGDNHDVELQHVQAYLDAEHSKRNAAAHKALNKAWRAHYAKHGNAAFSTPMAA
jgi:hypothetical protein